MKPEKGVFTLARATWRSLLLALACLGPAGADDGAWALASVTHVVDGDTVWIALDDAGPGGPSGRIKVRIEGIDAPEACQAWGREATDALRARLLGRVVQVQLRHQDVYARWLGQLRHEGEDIGAWMVAQGHAWSYRYRGRPGAYVGLEADARAEGRGLFSQAQPIPPAVFRQSHGPCR
jgi:endonuclease YncB( thermonuclease family)